MSVREQVEEETAARLGVVARVARWGMGHRLAMAAIWLALLAGSIGAAVAIGATYSTNLSLPGTESQAAADLLRRDFPAQAGDVDQIVLRARDGRVTDAEIRRQVAPMLARVAELPHVTGVVSPYSPAGADAVSRDGRIAFATVMFDAAANDLPRDAAERVVAAAERVRSPALQVELGGAAIQGVQAPSLGSATAVALIAAVIVLLLTFGSFVAMGLPIVTALLGLGTGVGAGILASHVVDTVDFSTEVGVMIGLGVGIDYALFIITRFREAYRGGAELRPAIVTAMDTAGRAILFAGATVIVALLGLFLLGVSLLYGLAVAASLTVLFTMLASLTILPVLLTLCGRRIGRVPRWRGRRGLQRAGSPVGGAEGGGGGQGRPTLWHRWATLVPDRPWPALLLSLAILLALTAPVATMRLGSSDAGNDPQGQTTRAAYDLLADGFGAGFNGPLLVVAQLPAGDGGTLAERDATLDRVAATLRATDDVAQVAPPALSPGGGTATLQVFPRSAPQAEATTDLVDRLRERLPALERETGATLLVGGPTAAGIDFAQVLSSKLPLFVGLVVAVSALLLLVVFRSVAIPIQAAVMNLLSIAASLGVIVLVFQHGWLGGLLGVEPAPIEAFIPVVMFAIVFGLSMDYEVFLVSRIREEWLRRRDPTRAIVDGVASTGRVITAAATIMICVFASFTLGDNRGLKLFGLSFATAVFLDAFVIRSLLLPATLQLLGPRTWWLPRR